VVYPYEVLEKAATQAVQASRRGCMYKVPALDLMERSTRVCAAAQRVDTHHEGLYRRYAGYAATAIGWMLPNTLFTLYLEEEQGMAAASLQAPSPIG